MDKQRFFFKIRLLLPFVAIALSFNYVIDPAHLFQRGTYEKGIADLLLQGKNVANVSNYDDRLLQKYYIEGLSQGKDVLVFGSSRAMAIHSNVMPDKTFFNHSVSGASLEDHIAIYQLYRQKGFKPSVVILGMDPWLLNRNNAQTQWKTLSPEYQAAMRRLGLPSETSADPFVEASLGRWTEVLSPNYFQESFSLWRYSIEKKVEIPGRYYPTDDLIGDERIKLSDGSLSNRRVERAGVYAGVTRNALVTLKKFVALDPGLNGQLEAWVSSLQSDGVRVVFFLSPYELETYKFLTTSDQYKIVLHAQAYYRELAKQKEITVLGSLNPEDIPCDRSEFYDEQHPKESCIEKAWAQYR